MNKKLHWESVYETKPLENTSWYQPVPITAIEYLAELNVPKDASIIDIGGGDSFFVDYLLDNNFTNISVLDISEKALERAKNRLGAKASSVNWIVADASIFAFEQKYDFWFDRAAFHFLTDENEIESYVNNCLDHVSDHGSVVIGTFSDRGPKKCSGIDIRQYSANELEEVFSPHLGCKSCRNIDHPTPFDTIQNFTFCSFAKS